jgi:hypothetical protein
MNISMKGSEQRPIETKRVSSQSSKPNETSANILQEFYIKCIQQRTGSPWLNVEARFLKTATQNNKCRMEQIGAGPPNLIFEHPARENNINQSPENVH